MIPVSVLIVGMMHSYPGSMMHPGDAPGNNMHYPVHPGHNLRHPGHPGHPGAGGWQPNLYSSAGGMPRNMHMMPNAVWYVHQNMLMRFSASSHARLSDRVG